MHSYQFRSPYPAVRSPSELRSPGRYHRRSWSFRPAPRFLPSAFATVKGIFALHAGDACRQIQIFQITALIKRTLANAGNAFWYFNGGQTRAPGECIGTNFRHTIRQLHFCQLRTPTEHRCRVHRGDLYRKLNLFQRRAVVKTAEPIADTVCGNTASVSL